jgi:ABC-type hemin transport system substrate-binding protein
MNRRTAMAWGVLGVGALLASCGREPRPPSTGPSETGPSAPPAREGLRIVVLSPAVGVILRDLGLATAIVGRHSFDMALDPAIPAVGDHLAVDLERLLALRPTHVLGEFGAGGVPASLAEAAAREGWIVRSQRLRTLDEITLAMDELAALLGVMPPQDEPSPGARLGGAFAPSDEKARAAAGAAGRVLLLGATRPAAALGPGSCHVELAQRLGAAPVPAEGGPWQELDAESVLALSPDSIVIFAPRVPAEAPGAEAWGSAAERLGVLARLDIPALRAGRVAVIEHPLALLPSSSLAEVARELEAVFVAWASGDGP